MYKIMNALLTHCLARCSAICIRVSMVAHTGLVVAQSCVVFYAPCLLCQLSIGSRASGTVTVITFDPLL